MVIGVSLGFFVSAYTNLEPNLQPDSCLLDPQEPNSYFKIKESEPNLLKGTLYFKENLSSEVLVGQLEVSLSKEIAKNYKNITCP